ncbi:zinc finger protein 85-like [Armigeres subalbatus]|uniref:zinc finger protein 85-like n=1 Tax=Armigeres subalbatus TaxID=124917 RepID=UPI002ED0C313
MNFNQVQVVHKCRLCLASEGSPTSSMDDHIFRTKLDAVCNYAFVSSDDLPSKVCLQCTSKITDMYEFLQTVVCNQKMLHSMVKPIFPKEDTPPKNEIFLELAYEIKEEPTIKQENTSEDEHIVDSIITAELCKVVEDSKESELFEKPAEPLSDDILIKQYFNLSCDECSTPFDTYKQFSEHSRLNHNQKPTLHCCNKTFQIKHKILRHINTHLRPFKCEECAKTFTDAHALQVHKIGQHLSSEDKPFKCDKCPKSFQKQQLLRSHLKLHERVDCSICKKSFSNVYAMKNHTKMFHSEKQPKFICDVCGKEFKSYNQVETHRVVHIEPTLEDGARCEICHTWISRKNRLRRHMVDIHQSKESECDICHKTYPNVKGMKKHRNSVHVGLNFECDLCGKRFKKSLNLKEHRASAHTGQKLYSCEFCGWEMNSNGNLYSHKKKKHPQEWMEAKQKVARLKE